MKPVVDFFKNTILGGLLVLLPMLLLWGLLTQAFGVVFKIATPIVRLLPKGSWVDTPLLKELVAVALLVGASFLFGILLRASFVRGAVKRVENNTLNRLSFYSVLKNLVSAAVQRESSRGFRPAMLLLSEGMQRPAYVIEDHGDGNLTVFLPSAPAAFSGMVHVVSRDRIVFLDVKLSELIRSIIQYGAGHRELLQKKMTTGMQGDGKTFQEAK
jgi:uncharacterized membrane protein